MSAKAKAKIKNNEPNLAEAVAVASAVETTPLPATPTSIEPTPTDATGETPPRPTLLFRARIATSKAVVTLFARARTVQARAKDKSLAWITAADVGLSKSLLAGEQYLLVRLRVTPVD